MSASGGSHQAADHGDALRFRRDALDRLSVPRDERRTVHQVARRITADRQFGKQNESGPGGSRALREFDDLGGVAGEISDGRIDLAERNLHAFSVKGTRGRSAYEAQH